MADVALAEPAGLGRSPPRAFGLFRHRGGLLGALALFALFYLIYNFNHPRGFTSQVLIQNSNELFTLAMIAMAQTVPVLLGGLDLSVGAVMTLVNCVASELLSGTRLEIFLGMLVCLGVGAGFGFVNGCVVVYGRIQPIIATLASGAIALGIALFIRSTPGGTIDDDLAWAATNGIFDLVETLGFVPETGPPAWLGAIGWIPVPLIALVLVALLVWVPFRRSPLGRTVYAIGSAEGAAYMSGLPIARAKLAAFTLSGLFAGFGGLFLAIQTSSGNADIPQAGAYTLNSIAAVVIGGTSLLGGSGGALGSIVGAGVLRAISFNFRIFDVPPLLQPLVEGLVLLSAVSLGALQIARVKNRLDLFR